MRIIYFTPVFIFSFFGCILSKNLTEEEVVGIYSAYDFELMNKLEIKSNGNFQYDWQQGLLIGTTKGTWKIENNNLLLTSQRQQEDFKETAVKFKTSYSKDSLTINVLEYSTNESLIAMLEITQSRNAIISKTWTDLNGNVTIPFIKNMDTILISMTGYRSEKLAVSDLTFFEFDIYLKEIPDLYVYFKKKKIKFKGNSIHSSAFKPFHKLNKEHSAKN